MLEYLKSSTLHLSFTRDQQGKNVIAKGTSNPFTSPTVHDTVVFCFYTRQSGFIHVGLKSLFVCDE